MATPSLRLSLQFARFTDIATHRAALPRHCVLRYLRASLNPNVLHAEFAVRIVDADEGQHLNRDFRHKDYATNVLTFDYSGAPQVMADLVLCAPVVAREAQQMHKPLGEHYAHLLIHGALHAQGWDHETNDADAEAMEARESAIMTTLGFADPYAKRK